jgi:hypothetical protein
MEQTGCSETSVYKLQTPGNYPKESIQHLEQGESLKSRKTKTRWNEAVEEVSKKILSLRNAKREAMDRQVWTAYVQRPKFDIGLLRHKEEEEYFSR